MEDMKITRDFVFIYALFTILLIMFGMISNLATFDKITLPQNPTLEGILNFVGVILSFFINLLLYSTDSWIINIILWAYRILMVLELALYFKKLINPASN